MHGVAKLAAAGFPVAVGCRRASKLALLPVEFLACINSSPGVLAMEQQKTQSFHHYAYPADQS